MSVNERIGSIIQSDKSLSQKNLAASIGVPASTVNNWLKLGRSIPIEYAIPISEYLKISFEYLLTGKESSSAVPLAPADQELLDLFHSLPDQTRNDFLGMLRIMSTLYSSGVVGKENPEKAG